jgi:hypothetical protein
MSSSAAPPSSRPVIAEPPSVTRPSEPWRNASLIVPAIAAAAVFACACALVSYADPDVFHGLALFREATRLGHVPFEDRFAYTPTVYPSVHHEWGHGAVLYAAAMWGGAAGLLVLKYLLAAALAFVCLRCARRRGATLPLLLAVLLLPMLLGLGRFGSTVRAQAFTFIFLALLLGFLDEDRAGRRWWMAPWLFVYLLWLNLHAGFLVGAGFVFLHLVEQIVRRRPFVHLAALLAAMAALGLVNPYGASYYAFLTHAVSLDRTLIGEWGALPGYAPWPVIGGYVVSALLIVYCLWRLGLRRTPGILLVIVAAVAAYRHVRHLDIYAVTWLCYVPGLLQQTRLGAAVERFWHRRARLITVATGALAVASSAVFLAGHPWILHLPANPGDHPKFTYPVGAVAYLNETGFAGNALVPFTVGGFVMWELSPRVKVSMDSRYEAAYPDGAVQENYDFYHAKPGWQDVLGKYPTDIVLVSATGNLSAVMPQSGWTRAYQDDAFEIYARPGLNLPPADRRGQRLVGHFP